MTTAIRASKAIGIIRVSQKEQRSKDDDGEQRDKYGPEVQCREIEDKAGILDSALVDVWDYQESATDFDNRPKFNEFIQRLVAMGRSGEIDTVIFGRPDRLGRDGEDAFFYYLTTLERTGKLQVRFARDDVDPDNLHRNFLLFLHAFKAKSDALTIRKNTTAGKRRRAERGKLATGNPPWPFDYESKKAKGKTAKQVPVLNPERAKWVRQWVRWILDEKISLREICRRMQVAGVYPPKLQIYLDSGYSLERALTMRYGSLVWTPTTIKRLLASKTMLGEFWSYARFDPDDEKPSTPILVHKDDSLGILTTEEFSRIQIVLAENRILGARNAKRYYTPLKGFIWCHCGRKARGSYHNGLPYFSCDHCKDRDGCKTHITNVKTMWEQVKRNLVVLVSDPDQLSPVLSGQAGNAEERAELEGRKEAIEAEIKDLDGSLDRVTRMFAILDGYGEDKLKSQVLDIRKREDSLRAQLQQVENALKARYEAKLTQEGVRFACERMRDVLESATDEEWRNFMRDCDFRVILQVDGNHTMQLSLSVEPSPSIVFPESRSLCQ